jgi:hypothetical protein
MKFTLNIATLLTTAICICSAITSNAQIKSTTLTISNTSKVMFAQKVIEIPWKIISQKWPGVDTSQLIVIDPITKKQIIYQFDLNAANEVQNVLVQLNIGPNQSKQLLFSYGKKVQFNPKTYGRYIPERKDDFAWENDKIAFRMYGKELEKTPKEMGYGMDVWVKRTDRMILNERYKRGEYHIDHGDGMDYYHVGFSLGAGSMMPFYNDSIYYSKNYVNYKVINNGPLRTTFQLFYDAWPIGSNNISAVKTITLDAGSQFNKITVNYLGVKDATFPVIAGLIEREGKGVKYADEMNGIMTYWEPMHGVDGTTGVACIFPSAIQRITEYKGQMVAMSNTDQNHSITYYAGAVWDKAGFISNADQWNNYAKHYKLEVNNTSSILIH